MTSMNLKSDAEWWADFNRADKTSARRRHPAGKARTPIDTAQDFHNEVAAIDAQTGRVLPRRVLPRRIAPTTCMVEPPAPPVSRAERLALGLIGIALSALYGWAVLAVFYGWEGLV